MTITGGAATRGATSLDGRTFTFGAGGGGYLAGSMVLLHGPGLDALGQVTSPSAPAGGGPDRSTGEGVVVAAVGEDGATVRREVLPFADVPIDVAPAGLLESLQHAVGATVPVGVWRSGPCEVVARLRAGGFNRHTFLCGQSGSGKTYALGVLLEQLLLATDLRLVVLDPNADFVRLGELRRGAPAAVSARLGPDAVRVLRADGAGGEPLRLRFATMPPRAQAAVLQLDPVADRAEYNQFLHTMAMFRAHSVAELAATLQAGSPDERALGQRLENLGMAEWEVWAAENPSAAEVVDVHARATVMDLGGFHDPLEPLAVSLDVLEDLWARRAHRVPTLVVVDEAHNLCAGEPTSALQERVTSRLVQIAAEGRKYGLWLLLSTQRPSKIHPQVLSQCDNLALMRMNSRTDLDELAKVFGFVPRGMLQAAPHFVQGEMLLAGAFAPVPSRVRVGARLTFEGGGDVSVPMWDPSG